MGGEIAARIDPFYGRIRISPTILSGRIGNHMVAALALLHDLVATAAIVSAATIAHKQTIDSWLNGVTIHLFASSFLIEREGEDFPQIPRNEQAHGVMLSPWKLEKFDFIWNPGRGPAQPEFETK